MGLNLDSPPVLHPLGDVRSQTYADALTLPMVVPTASLPVVTAISVQDADSVVMLNQIAIQEREKLTKSLQPKYLRYNTWVAGHFSSCTADWTMIASPLPSIPFNKHNNPITITCNPSLFKIVTPIDINLFESLLSTHPNQPFVMLVCKGLREGFWPWADTLLDGFPITHDASWSTINGVDKSNFLKCQIQMEQFKHRFSSPFGPDLLPGMYSMPIYVVPKPNSLDFCMVADHSFGPFSLNAMIPHCDIAGYPLDNLKHLGEVILNFHKTTEPNKPLVIYKSDVSEAYQLLPVHKKWQVKQVNTINGQHYINCASGSIWISFNALVLWIARYICNVECLLEYVDDFFNVARASSLIHYKPFNKSMPKDQVALLNLWTELGIPFKEKKQVFGSPLMVIGIDVDPNNLTYTLPAKAKSDLL